MFVSAPRNVHFRLSESRAVPLHCARFSLPSSPAIPPLPPRIVDTINALLAATQPATSARYRLQAGECATAAYAVLQKYNGTVVIIIIIIIIIMLR